MLHRVFLPKEDGFQWIYMDLDGFQWILRNVNRFPVGFVVVWLTDEVFVEVGFCRSLETSSWV